jgi:IclR family transcriptional regulator, mhp operon transcriptional activator
MPRAETIRALERGIEVLAVLQSHSICSLRDVHLATRIPKPSLLRILKTLERAGIVSRRLADGHYRMSLFTRPTRKRDRYAHVAEAAAPVLDRLCRKVLWPSDLFVPAGPCMERRETSRPLTPFFIHPGDFKNLGVVVRANWLITGVGRAYLAYCSEAERDAIIRRLRKSDRPEDRLARDPKRLERILADTRARGYAVRDPSFVGGSYNRSPFDDGLAAIVVPLFDGERVHGSINILFVRTAYTVEQFAARHLADLQAAAREIVASLPDDSRNR